MNENILIEISAVNGRFILDFIQNFSNPVYFNAFLKQIQENGISCELQQAMPIKLAAVRLPWVK